MCNVRSGLILHWATFWNYNWVSMGTAHKLDDGHRGEW